MSKVNSDRRVQETAEAEIVSNGSVPVLDALPESWPATRGPLLVREAVPHWPVHQLLSSGALLRDFGDVKLVARGAAPQPWHVSLREFWSYCESVSGDTPRWYSKDWTLGEDLPAFCQLPLPVPLRSWFDRLPVSRRPPWNWLFVGPAGSSSRLHVDTMCSSAWNVLVQGQKRWTLYSPAAATRMGLLEPEPAAEAGGADLAVSVIQSPGDLLLVPSGWAHSVTNSAMSVALTGNFVNGDNWRVVRSYLDATGKDRWMATLRRLAELTDGTP